MAERKWTAVLGVGLVKLPWRKVECSTLIPQLS